MRWDGAAARCLSAVGSRRKETGFSFRLALATRWDDAQIRDPCRAGRMTCFHWPFTKRCIPPGFGAHPKKGPTWSFRCPLLVPRRSVVSRPRNACQHTIWRDMHHHLASPAGSGGPRESTAINYSPRVAGRLPKLRASEIQMIHAQYVRHCRPHDLSLYILRCSLWPSRLHSRSLLKVDSLRKNLPRLKASVISVCR